MKYVAKITGWVGRRDGSSVLLVDGEEVPDTDPLVHERPDLVVPVVLPRPPAKARKTAR